MGRLGFLFKFWDNATFFLLNIFVELTNKIQVMYIQVDHMSMFLPVCTNATLPHINLRCISGHDWTCIRPFSGPNFCWSPVFILVIRETELEW
jgi:hypothetical protein